MIRLLYTPLSDSSTAVEPMNSKRSIQLPREKVLLLDAEVRAQESWLNAITGTDRQKYHLDILVDERPLIGGAIRSTIQCFVPMPLPFIARNQTVKNVLDWYCDLLRLECTEKKRVEDHIEKLGIRSYLAQDWLNAPFRVQWLIGAIAFSARSPVLSIVLGQRFLSEHQERDSFIRGLMNLSTVAQKTIVLLAADYRTGVRIFRESFEGFLPAERTLVDGPVDVDDFEGGDHEAA